jgi:superfamily II DNA helicase RecQ
VVVLPLLSLIRDKVAIAKGRGIPHSVIQGAMSQAAIETVKSILYSSFVFWLIRNEGKLMLAAPKVSRLVFMTPEMFASNWVQEIIQYLRKKSLISRYTSILSCNIILKIYF